MGYIRHHAIVVTGYEPHVQEAHALALDLAVHPVYVTDLTASGINGYRSFLVAPDGSKEGWADSDEGDRIREAFLARLRSEHHLYVDWCEVGFGGDEAHMMHARGPAGLVRGEAKDEHGDD